jgi:flagellum-specific ATP synthase
VTSLDPRLPEAQRASLWSARLAQLRKRAQAPLPLIVEGRLTRMAGLTLEAVGCQAAVGTRCLISAPHHTVEAEVVGFAQDKLFLMATGDMRGLMPNARVIPSGKSYEVAVGKALLGRVLNGHGKPLDGKGAPRAEAHVPLAGRLINPLLRRPISEPLDVGVRSINTLLTVGRGQRMGLFAGSGVGKSVLLGMMTRYTTADVIVVGLIGERGREVKEFIEHNLGAEGLRRAVVVAVPADHPPLLRLQGAALATAIAEYFRDRGLQVLLLMDSLTRYAQAQREIALAIGEPPATKGYPPSVFAMLPQLVERAGNSDHAGSITAFYTVLAEGDDHNDPIADAARAILDGHIVLARRLADAGHYPAVDVETSVSRAMNDITSSTQQELARRFKQLHATYRENYDLINVGAYVPGSDARVDEAIAMHPRLLDFLKQDMRQRVPLADGVRDLDRLLQTAQQEPPVNTLPTGPFLAVTKNGN